METYGIITNIIAMGTNFIYLEGATFVSGLHKIQDLEAVVCDTEDAGKLCTPLLEAPGLQLIACIMW